MKNKYLKFNIKGLGGFIATHKDVFEFLELHFEEEGGDIDVHFEEVYMTKELYEKLPEFDGF